MITTEDIPSDTTTTSYAYDLGNSIQSINSRLHSLGDKDRFIADFEKDQAYIISPQGVNSLKDTILKVH